jgi:hypothetical protein
MGISVFLFWEIMGLTGEWMNFIFMKTVHVISIVSSLFIKVRQGLSTFFIWY